MSKIERRVSSNAQTRQAGRIRLEARSFASNGMTNRVDDSPSRKDERFILTVSEMTKNRREGLRRPPRLALTKIIFGRKERTFEGKRGENDLHGPRAAIDEVAVHQQTVLV